MKHNIIERNDFMGKIFTAVCNDCNRIYNFDVGISNLYNKKTLLDIKNDFNLLLLFKENKRKNELEEIINSKLYDIDDSYGHKVFICDTCKNLYSRFDFKLINKETNDVFQTKFLCHKCKKKLRALTSDNLINDLFECPNCKKEIKFHISGDWN